MTATLPEQHRAAVLVRPGEIAVRERARPEPGAGEVLVAVRSVGICGSDVHYFTDGRIGDFVVEQPLVLGHEASGVVVAVGPGCRALTAGRRVALEPGVPCGRCTQCRAGRYNLCPDVRFFATPPIDGTFAQYVTIAEDFAHPIPDSMSFDEAALVEPLSVAVWANGKAGVRPGDSVLVTGAGPIGVLCALVARARGAAHVTICDISAERLARARRLGCAEDYLEGPDAPADVLLECSGAAGAIDAGLRALAPAGRAVLVGMPAGTHVSLPVAAIQSRELTVTGTFRYAGVYPVALELAPRIPLAELVDAAYSLDEVDTALRANALDPSLLKVVVRPPAEEVAGA